MPKRLELGATFKIHFFLEIASLVEIASSVEKLGRDLNLEVGKEVDFANGLS